MVQDAMAKRKKRSHKRKMEVMEIQGDVIGDQKVKCQVT